MSYSLTVSSFLGLPEALSRRDRNRPADDAPYPETALA